MLKDEYPKQITHDGILYTLRLMDANDQSAMLSLAGRLQEADMSFLSQDITQPAVVKRWIDEIKTDRAITILIEQDGRLVGYGSLHYNQLFWTRHLGEVRIMVTQGYRNRGLGSDVAQEVLRFAYELDLEKVVAYMDVNAKGAQKMLETLHFRAEAVLADWVKTRDDRMHDLLIMALALEGHS